MLAGTGASVVRAAFMGGVALVARETGRPGSALAALGLAVWMLLLLDPSMATDIGFQLSVTATAGLLWWGSRLTRRLAGASPGRPRGWLAESLGVSLAAQAATLPLVLFHFGRLSLVSPLANLLIAPIVAPAMLVGSVALVAGAGRRRRRARRSWVPRSRCWAGWCSAPWSRSRASSRRCRWRAWSCRPRWPRSSRQARQWRSRRSPGVCEVTAIQTCRPSVDVQTPRNRADQAPVPRRPAPDADDGSRSDSRPSPSSGVSAWRWAAASGPGRLSVTVLDVGQGDAILVEGPRGGRILLDSGPDPDRLLTVLDRHVPAWDRRLDLVVLTHPHEDHVAGLALLVQRYRVAAIAENGMLGAGPGDAAFRAWLSATHVSTRRLAAGDRLALDGVAMDVRWPLPGTRAGTIAQGRTRGQRHVHRARRPLR